MNLDTWAMVTWIKTSETTLRVSTVQTGYETRVFVAELGLRPYVHDDDAEEYANRQDAIEGHREKVSTLVGLLGEQVVSVSRYNPEGTVR